MAQVLSQPAGRPGDREAPLRLVALFGVVVLQAILLLSTSGPLDRADPDRAAVLRLAWLVVVSGVGGIAVAIWIRAREQIDAVTLAVSASLGLVGGLVYAFGFYASDAAQGNCAVFCFSEFFVYWLVQGTLIVLSACLIALGLWMRTRTPRRWPGSLIAAPFVFLTTWHAGAALGVIATIDEAVAYARRVNEESPGGAVLVVVVALVLLLAWLGRDRRGS